MLILTSETYWLHPMRGNMENAIETTQMNASIAVAWLYMKQWNTCFRNVNLKIYLVKNFQNIFSRDYFFEYIFTCSLVVLLWVSSGLWMHLNLSKLTAARDQISDNAATDPRNPLNWHPLRKKWYNSQHIFNRYNWYYYKYLEQLKINIKKYISYHMFQVLELQ